MYLWQVNLSEQGCELKCELDDQKHLLNKTWSYKDPIFPQG